MQPPSCWRNSAVPDARLDDLMISYATDGGGVGPHFDSYDVFLLQVSGRRRWRISSQTALELIPGLPLKIPPTSVRNRNGCWNRVTCFTCRRSMRMTVSPKASA